MTTRERVKALRDPLADACRKIMEGKDGFAREILLNAIKELDAILAAPAPSLLDSRPGPVDDPPMECKNCGAVFATHSFDCPNCHEPYPDDEPVVEQVARELARSYWRDRGEEITKEQEDEFWLSWGKLAARICRTRDAGLDRESVVQKLGDIRMLVDIDRKEGALIDIDNLIAALRSSPPPAETGLLRDAAKLLDVAGLWKAPVDEQWRQSYADWRERYNAALRAPTPPQERVSRS